MYNLERCRRNSLFEQIVKQKLLRNFTFLQFSYLAHGAVVVS